MSNVSRETDDRLVRYADLIRVWSRRINLVAPSTIDNLAERHIADSLQLLQHRPNPGPGWVDLGSGGGLPGLVVALASTSGETRFTLVESDSRKAAFLRRAVAELHLDNTAVVSARIEALPPMSASTVSARALAPLPKLLDYVARHLAPDGTALLMKGRNWRDELVAAQQDWKFDLMVKPSTTDPDAAILQIGNLRVR